MNEDLNRTFERDNRLKVLKAKRSQLAERKAAIEEEIEAVDAEIHGLEGEKEVDHLSQRHSATPTVSTPKEMPLFPPPFTKRGPKKNE